MSRAVMVSGGVKAIEPAVSQLKRTQALKYANVPVVAAAGLALGGGCEIDDARGETR